MTSRRIPAALATAGLVLALAACGGDDDDAATATEALTTPAATDPGTSEPAATAPAATTPGTGAPAGAVDPEFADYCKLSLELDQQQGPPTSEQMTAILAAAPPEIADAATTIVDAFLAAGDEAGPGVFEEHPDEMSAIDAFDAAHCGATGDTDEPPDPAVVSIDPAATRVDVDATDFHFAFDPPMTAGRYSFVMKNDGSETHMMILGQMEPGATLDELMASQGEQGFVQSFDSIPSEPGGESVVTADLTTGHWILVCPIPSEANDMQTHAAMGMVQEWDVS